MKKYLILCRLLWISSLSASGTLQLFETQVSVEVHSVYQNVNVFTEEVPMATHKHNAVLVVCLKGYWWTISKLDSTTLTPTCVLHVVFRINCDLMEHTQSWKRPRVGQHLNEGVLNVITTCTCILQNKIHLKVETPRSTLRTPKQFGLYKTVLVINKVPCIKKYGSTSYLKIAKVLKWLPIHTCKV